MIRLTEIPSGYEERTQQKSEPIPDEQLAQIRELVPQLAANNGLDWTHGYSITNNSIDGWYTRHDLYPGNEGLVVRTRMPIDSYNGGEEITERHILEAGQPSVRHIRALPQLEGFEATESWPIPTHESDFRHILRLLSDENTRVTPRNSERVNTGGSFGESGRRLAAEKARELRQRRFPLLVSLREAAASRLPFCR